MSLTPHSLYITCKSLPHSCIILAIADLKMSKQNVMARDILQCPDCKEKTQVVVDYSQGSVICRNCGLVLESSCIDDSQEWRSFSDSAGDSKPDRNRVGDIVSDYGPQRLQGTSIAGGSSRLSRTQFLAMSEGTDKTLAKAHTGVRDIMRALALPDNIYARCFDILKYMDDNDILRNRTSTSWMLAVVYMACRQERAGRQISELVRAAPTVKESEVARNYWRLDKLLAAAPVRAAQGISRGEDNFVVRYCNRLSVQSAEKLADFITQQASRFGITGSRNPGISAGVAVFIAAHLMNHPNKPSLDDIARVTDTKLAAVKSAYSSLRQPIDRLLPHDIRGQFVDAIQTLP